MSNVLVIRAVYVPGPGEVSAKEALPLLTDEFIDDGECCGQTIKDLRDALQIIVDWFDVRAGEHEKESYIGV